MNRVTYGPFQSMGSIHLCQYLKSGESLPQAFFERSIFLLTHLENKKSFDARGLVTWIYAIAKKGDAGKYILKGDCRLFPVWIKAAISKVDSFNAQDLVNSFYALGILGLQPPEDFLKVWVQNSLDKIHTFTTQNLSNSLYAFGMLGIQPSKDFLKAWIENSLRTIHIFKTQELANSLCAFSVLGIQPSEDFWQAWIENSLCKIHSFKTQELANSFYAFGRLARKPPKPFLKVLEAASLNKIDDFNEQNVGNSLYSYLLLSTVKETTFIKLDQLGMNALLHKVSCILNDNDVKLSLAAKQQYHTILTVLVAQNSFLINQKWTKRKLKQLEQELKFFGVFSASQLQKEIFHLASKLIKGVDLTLEHWEAKIATSIDIVCRSHTKKIAIQVDGRPHYYTDTALETSATKLNTLLLKEVAGYKVIRIKYSDWGALKSVSKKTAYLKNLIDPFVAPVCHAFPQIEAQAHDVLQQEKLLEKGKQLCESTPLYTPLKNRVKKKKGKALKACKSTLSSEEPVVASLPSSSAPIENRLWQVALSPLRWRSFCTIL